MRDMLGQGKQQTSQVSQSDSVLASAPLLGAARSSQTMAPPRPMSGQRQSIYATTASTAALGVDAAADPIGRSGRLKSAQRRSNSPTTKIAPSASQTIRSPPFDIGVSPVAKSVYQLVALHLSPRMPISGEIRKSTAQQQSATPSTTCPSASEEHLRQMFEYSMRILGSRISPVIVADESHITSLMQKHVARNDSSAHIALRMTNLLAKLSEKSIMRRRLATLCFLLSSCENSGSSMDGIITGTSGLRLGLKSMGPTAKPTARITPETTHLKADNNVDTFSLSIPRASVFNAYYVPQNIADAQRLTLSESELIRDMLFVFQGIDGRHIKFDMELGIYALDSQIYIPNPTRELVQRPCELGWHYRNISQCIKAAQESTSIRLYEQSFYATIQAELVDYYRMIAMLENQLDSSDSLEGSFFSTGLTLKRLYIWIQSPLQRLRNLSVLIDVCKGCKGGALISMIHNYVTHGDPEVREYIRRLLVEISRPFYTMLKRWIHEGELEDPYEEFFVSMDSSANINNLWRSKYTINYSLVPGFISKALAKKVFLIGKSLNFVRHSCADPGGFSLWSRQPADLMYGDLKKLEFSIDSAYQASNAHLMSVLFEKYNLMEHLLALKRFVLLGQGDFVQYLLDSLGSSLSKPASTLYRHNLSGALEIAIRSSNAQHQDADVLKRLDVRLLEATGGDTGWDVFTLDYHVDSPINTILTQQAMHTYLKLFTFLWRLKRVEHVLSSSWRLRVAETQTLRYVKGFAGDIQQCFILQSEMVHFVNQLQHYIFFEVIECSWNELIASINKKSRDLDLLIAAHNRYLNSIAMKGLLAVLPNQTTISKKLFKIFEIILAFDAVQESVFRLAADEQSHQNVAHATAYQIQLEAEFKLKGRASSQDRPSSLPSAARISAVRGRVQDAVDLFRTQVKNLLLSLADHPDQNLKLLGTRLNFNEVSLRFAML
ncbi:hypothetical protein BASA60_002985 [Batrachochytrium salamandrivorans]|nr:hypothetical protein BASA60_002985 [Batrachochytrium salamandrivorans]